MFNKLTAFAAAFALTASSALAGGLSPEIIESSPEEVVASPSVNPAYIVVGVLAALLIIAAVISGDGDDDDDDDECTSTTTTAAGAFAAGAFVAAPTCP